MRCDQIDVGVFAVVISSAAMETDCGAAITKFNSVTDFIDVVLANICFYTFYIIYYIYNFY